MDKNDKENPIVIKDNTNEILRERMSDKIQETIIQNESDNTPQIVYQGTASINTPIANIEVNANRSLTLEEGISTDSSISINKSIGEIKIQAGLTNNDGDLGYNLSINGEHETNNDVVTTFDASADTDGVSATLGVKKLINPNDPLNQDKARKEEMIENDSKWSLVSKVGYSKDKNGLYTYDSVMYRIDNSNFLKADFSKSEFMRELTSSADLRKVEIKYSNTDISEFDEESKETIDERTNSFDIKTKGKANLFKFSLSDQRIAKTNETTDVTHNYGVETNAIFNRTEYNEFNSGLNGDIGAKFTLDNNKQFGYNVTLDGSYNYYGEEHNGTTDYMGFSRIKFRNEDNEKTFSCILGGAYRINNCNTIIEPTVEYDTIYDTEKKTKSINGNIGIWQQVGKKFEDATVFTQFGAGKDWVKQENSKDTKLYANVVFGSNVKLNKKLTFDSKFNYDTSKKWGGEICFRYSL